MSRRVRIAFLTDIATPYMVAVLDALSHSAELTAVFCAHTGTRGMDWRVQLPFDHQVVDGLTIRRRTRDATDYYLSPRIVQALHRAHPQSVISGGFSIPSLYAAIYCRTRRIPLLIHSDGTAASEASISAAQLATRRLLRRVAWGAVANSEPAARRLIEIGFDPGRVHRAPHSAQLSPLWQVADTRPDGACSATSETPLRLLSVGRLIARKGHQALLRAVSQARRQGAEVELTVVGTGPQERRLRALAAELGVPVRWRGFVDQPELPAVYAAADAFAFPTLAGDPFGIVVLEAAAAGLALIASPRGGATEDLIVDGVNGLIVDPADTAAMAAAVARLAGDPQLRRSLGRAASAATRDRTPAACAGGYLEAVRAAIGAGA
jgi:glycosyltransferase involved in cell wall biosynthesis